MATPSPICAYVSERTGTALSKQQLSRLNEAISTRLKGQPEDVYLSHLKSRSGAHELAELMSAVSVHKTDLFRDEGQLEAVRSFAVLPKAREGRPLKVWSAGCATGEEVATLLILLAEAGAHDGSTVLGSDIAQTALDKAQALTFGPEVIRRVPQVLRGRYFHSTERGFELVAPLRARAQFVRHNLMDLPYPLPKTGGAFDLIFCRNVLIYFTESAFERTIAALADRLAPGGVLLLSAAEPLLQSHKDLELVRHAQSFMYVRRAVGMVPVKAPAPSAPPAPPLEVSYPRTITGEFRVAPAVGIPAPPAPPRRTDEVPVTQAPVDPKEEGVQQFQLVLEWAAAGQSDTATEQGLRRALYLAPDLACARYLLGMLFEQKGQKAEAASEYRRALSTLEDGTARPAAFFLNNERLKGVCQRALERTGFR